MGCFNLQVNEGGVESNGGADGTQTNDGGVAANGEGAGVAANGEGAGGGRRGARNLAQLLTNIRRKKSERIIKMKLAKRVVGKNGEGTSTKPVNLE